MAGAGTLSELNHPIVEQSFAIIDREIGEHDFDPLEYAIVRRVIHATADFEFARLLRFAPGAIESGIACLRGGSIIITDVTMVKQGIATLVAKTFDNQIIAAVEGVSASLPGKTRTQTGLLQCLKRYPDAIYVIGNAPTALSSLCCSVAHSSIRPGLVIGAPVGFVSVLESKQALAKLAIPQIRVEGRKGGSPVAAAIVNALLVLAWESSS